MSRDRTHQKQRQRTNRRLENGPQEPMRSNFPSFKELSVWHRPSDTARQTNNEAIQTALRRRESG